MQEAITTFEQAKAVLAQHGLTVEKSLEPRLWQVGAHRFDKGGVIQEARAVLARAAERTKAERTRYDPIETDLDAGLFTQLHAAGWRWEYAKRARNGWHHLVSRGTGNHRLLLKERLVALVAEQRQAEDTEEQHDAGSMPMTLFIRQIRRDGGTQSRAQLDEATVEEYAEAMRNGAAFPAVQTVFDGTDHWLSDGYHRIAAAERVGKKTFAVEVRQGTRRDAVLDSCGVNATHGLPRSTQDKERAVLTLLQDNEWGQWSYREIARRCRVSHDFVGKVAQRHGFTGRASSDRTYTTRHGSVSTINTANIAAANVARTAKEPSSDPQPGEIHPIIAAAMEPEPTPATTATPPQRFILEPPAIAVPADLVLKGWEIRPPSPRSSVYSGYNHRLEIGTHGFNTLDEAITAARGMQEQIEDIEAAGWEIHHDTANPRLVYATQANESIRPVPSLYALHQRVMEWAATTARPEISTVANNPADTDLGDRLHAIEQAGYAWKAATYTVDGWRHLIVRADAPDMVRQRLTVAGIDNLLQINTSTSTTPAASASAESAAPTVTADAPALDWQQIEATAVQLHVCNIQRNRDGLITTALDLLRLAAAPSQIVLPLYPTDQAEALITEIRVLLEQQLDQAAPKVARLLRDVGRFVDQPPTNEEIL
jgi:hypothetical protein